MSYLLADISLIWILGIVAITFFIIKTMTQTKPNDIIRIKREGATIIDVRSPGEFAGGSVAGAVNIPVDRLQSELPDQGKPVLCFCASGMRSANATRVLKAAGYEAYNVGSLMRAHKLLG